MLVEISIQTSKVTKLALLTLEYILNVETMNTGTYVKKK